ncbi:hypothetical protein, partial [Caldibacillus thermoamylovorans]|uniref:hypothetical protein n=1 Tax=Caldibacillus thermoamylovorans TaxID=35841 RepID=UPI001F21217C
MGQSMLENQKKCPIEAKKHLAMGQNELKIKKKCLIGPCYGTKHAGKSEEMSHRSKETSGYG